MKTSCDIESSAKQVVERCRKLAEFSEDSNGIRRTFLCAPMRECHREIRRWLEVIGAEVTIDAVGNLRGLYAGEEADSPRLLIGSHLDTVPNAGAFDGVLGVVLAIALIEGLEGRRLPFAVEVVGFSEEEGVRFGAPFIGSRALVGRLDSDLLSRRDQNGVSVREAITNFGLDPQEIPQAALVNKKSLGYIEFHIEQGPVLESLAKPLAVVETIVGQTRLEFTFTGHANHAGTTPMHLRRDALAGAAEWISAVEKKAASTSGLVATVGRIQAKPGAVNVIARETSLTLDIRHASDEILSHAVDELTAQAEEISERRGLLLRQNILMQQKAVPMNPFLAGQIEEAIRAAGCDPHCMASGAGHDAMILAEKVPAGMIFLRTPGGISHDPAESVAVDDVAKAIDCGLNLLDQLAASQEFQTRTKRA